jgi:hypothetical protein
MPDKNWAEDYIPVNERIAAFYAAHPEGSIQSELVELSESRVVMRAYAYRSQDDQRPGIGYSSLEIPGRTPYTRGSEIENCETSAWGRAIAALGFEVKRGIASAEEVQTKTAEREAPKPRAARPRPAPVPEAIDHSSEPPEDIDPDELDALFDDSIPTPTIPPQGPERLTSSAFFALVEENGIDKRDAGNAARKLFGKDRWKITELSDEERAILWSEELAPR